MASEITLQIKSKNTRNREKFINRILEIREANAQDAGTVSYT